MLETHVSYVLLTGTYAYKIKKAVKLAFLDFTTLAARRRFCEQELRLNRRLAPDLYLDVVEVTGTVEAPELAGRGPVLDYAVKMREFPQQMLLPNLLRRNEFTAGHIDALAAQVAAFHEVAPVASTASGYGQGERILELALSNFAEITKIVDPSERAAVARLEHWTRQEYAARPSAFAQRRDGRAIRECHGDLHLANIVLIDGKITIFDCIEFNDEMRWIDTMSEVAFTVMDLEQRGHVPLARRFLSAYLERSGDYGGCAVLRFYLVYRAMVRAKIAWLRAAQLAPAPTRSAACREFSQYLRLAGAYAEAGQRAIVVMHGPSGSGKSMLSQLLLECTGAVRIRTDVERKRPGGLSAGTRSGSAVESGLYSYYATRRTYEQVLTYVTGVLEGGLIALVDGAFLLRWQRDLFRRYASEQSLPFAIVDCVATPSTLRARVAVRVRAATDASEADLNVLTHQLRIAEPLDNEELRYTIKCSAEGSMAGTFSACADRLLRELWRVRMAPTVGG